MVWVRVSRVLLLVLAGAVLIFVWAGRAQAAPTEVVIQSVTVNTDWTATVTITGTGFDTKQDTEVVLGGDQLTILSETSTEIVAELPSVTPGGYLLEVIVSGRDDEFDLTITEDQDFEAEIAALQSSVSDLSDTVASLETQVADQQDDITALQTQVADQQDDITALQTLLAGVTRGVDENTGADTIMFSGMNLQVVNGTGVTDGTYNYTGNIIVGYNELRPSGLESEDSPDLTHRRGSHNLVIGDQHEYGYTSGLVVGLGNSLEDDLSAIVGGTENYTIGYGSVVLGGSNNLAVGDYSAVVGGTHNITNGESNFVAGGTTNGTSINANAAVVGGEGNAAEGESSFVAGAQDNTAGNANKAIVGGVDIN